MVVLLEELNKLRDHLNTDINGALLGTDGTAPTENDTGLIAPVLVTQGVVSIVITNKHLTTSYTLNAVTGNGFIYAEFGHKANSNATDVNRVTFFPLEKNQTETFEITTQFNFSQA